MNHIVNLLIKIGILKDDLDYHLMRASLVFIAFSLVIRNGSNMKPMH
jgi:hypothetical protein